LKILTAYKSGGIYNEGHIARLEKQVEKYSGLKLTTVFGEYPHWWCKMNIFQVEGPCLFMDLDTTIVDDLAPIIEIAKTERFVTLRDFNYPDRVQSSIMSWSGDMSHIHSAFAEDPEGNMDACPGGDQEFIDNGGYHQEYWQDLLPNHIQSYKKHVNQRGIHKKCRIIAFHGNPRPWAIDELVKE